jgi:hypothetical protein
VLCDLDFFKFNLNSSILANKVGVLFCGSVSDTLFPKVENSRHQKDATLLFIRVENGVRNLNYKNVKITDQDGPVAGM